jgi:hypothetical protein
MAESNRRGFYRAEIRIPLKYRVLFPEEVIAVRQGSGKSLFRGGRMGSPMDDLVQQATPGSDNEHLYRCFQILNNKLDFLIEEVFLRPDGSAPMRGDLIDISGSGLKFACRDHVSIGSLLKLDLIIPATAQYQLEMVAEVVRVEARQGGYIMACHIKEIEEACRESIIQVVFQKQRSDIRNARGDQEDLDED